MMEKFGRKNSFLILNVIFVIGWIIVVFSQNVPCLLTGRFVTGLCIGLIGPVAPVFIGEITQPIHRGIFLTTIGLSVSIGIMIPHILGIYFLWTKIAMICAFLPFFAYLLTIIIPESPSWLLRHKGVAEAEESWHWYRGYDDETTNQFRELVDGQSQTKIEQTKNSNRLWTIMKSRSFYKPLIVLIVYFGTIQFSGSNAIAFYTVTILKESLGGSVNEYAATIAVDAVRLGSSIVACVVVKKYGRRPLTMFSGIGTSFSLFFLSLHLYLSADNIELKRFYGIPLTLILLYVFFLTIGLTPIAWTLTGELIPLKYRAIGSALVTSFNFFGIFAVVKTSPTLFEMYHDYGAFLVYGILCFSGTIWLMIFMPETKNRTLQDIEESYEDKPKSLKAVKTHPTV